jgi:3-deoxy-7-phosphoheptulonate synthase
MIVHVHKTIPAASLDLLGQQLQAAVLHTPDRHILVTPSSLRTLNGQMAGLEAYIEQTFVFTDDRQLSALEYTVEKRTVNIGSITLGGTSDQCVMIAGPCSIESAGQIDEVAQFLLARGIKTLRAGCYKPRTSPYSFQGMGLEGLKLLAAVRERYGFSMVTEARDATHIDEIIEYADVIQVGAKAMYDQGILRRCGKANKPVLIKRGFGSTLQEFVQAAEFVLSAGNDQVMLCERGIRTFETKTRFTLDLCGVAWLKAHTNLPLILDPSHAMGYRYGVADLARACVAMGIDGLLIETHPNPDQAKSDASQQLNFDQFSAMHESLVALAPAVGKRMV